MDYFPITWVVIQSTVESSGFPEDVQVLPGNGSPGNMQVAAVEGSVK